MKKWVLGFFFCGSRVLLIEKKRPDWMAGKLNGIGGKIEEGEHPLPAMMREFKEETGIETTAEGWRHFGMMNFDGGMVHCYTRREDGFTGFAQSLTDEQVNWYNTFDLHEEPIIPNLKWLIPMAMDYDHIEMLVKYEAERQSTQEDVL